MNKVNQSKVEVEHHKSLKGSFEVLRRHISVAIGGKRDTGAWDGGHPFDVELVVIPKGKKNYPYHDDTLQKNVCRRTSGFAVSAGRRHGR